MIEVKRVATVAYLMDAADDDLDLGPAVADRLAGLGVTSLVLFRDGGTLCLVLEGWTFDASSSDAAASAIGVEAGARTLHPIMRTALRAAG